MQQDSHQFRSYREFIFRQVIAVEEEERLVPGGFYRDNKVPEAETAKLAGLAEMQTRLWQESEQLTQAQ